MFNPSKAIPSKNLMHTRGREYVKEQSPEGGVINAEPLDKITPKARARVDRKDP